MPYSEVFTQQGISWDHQVFVAGCRVTGHGLRLQKPLIFGVLTTCVLVPTEFRRSRYIFLPFRLFIFLSYSARFFTIPGKTSSLVLRTVTTWGILEVAAQKALCPEPGQVELVTGDEGKGPAWGCWSSLRAQPEASTWPSSHQSMAELHWGRQVRASLQYNASPQSLP